MFWKVRSSQICSFKRLSMAIIFLKSELLDHFFLTWFSWLKTLIQDEPSDHLPKSLDLEDWVLLGISFFSTISRAILAIKYHSVLFPSWGGLTWFWCSKGSGEIVRVWSSGRLQPSSILLDMTRPSHTWIYSNVDCMHENKLHSNTTCRGKGVGSTTPNWETIDNWLLSERVFSSSMWPLTGHHCFLRWSYLHVHIAVPCRLNGIPKRAHKTGREA